MPKLVADALDVLVTVVLLLAAVGLLIAALGTGHAGLAWGSVGLSAVVAALILRRWRRSWLQRQNAPEDEPALLLEDERVDAGQNEQPLRVPVAGAQEVTPVTASTEVDAVTGVTQPAEPPSSRTLSGEIQSSETQSSETQSGETEPAEEDTDAADLLVVYELTDEVLVVDEHPRYHLARCQWPDHARADRLPVREARELGFTPCGRCRPDKVLAREHRAARAPTSSGG